MAEVFFTADHHFFHLNILRLQGRPYSTLEQMHEDYIQRWNARVGAKDVVYHLGDLSFSSAARTQQAVGRLVGKLRVVPGNHDGWLNKWMELCTQQGHIDLLKPITEISLASKYIVLCHYPMRTWNRSHHGSWHLHGHSHGSQNIYPRSLDVGVDVFPGLVAFEELSNLLGDF